MCHNLLNDCNFFRLLARIDAEFAEQAHAAGCPGCGGRLDRADYPRKPRGIDRGQLGEDYSRRRSFCCSRDGCRRRVTPPSVRFLGRRVYLGVIVVRATVVQSGATLARFAALSAQLPVSKGTLARWGQWWRESFVVTRFWHAARGQVATPLAPATLPSSLLAVFPGALTAALVALLRFIAPVTTRSGDTMSEG